MTISPQSFFKQGPVQIVGSEHDLAQEFQQPQQEGYFSRLKNIVGEDLNKRADNAMQILHSNVNPLRKGVQLLGQGAGLAANTLEQTVMQSPVVKPVIEGGTKAVFGATNFLSGRNVQQDMGTAQQAYDQWATKHPEAAKDLEGVTNIARLGLDITGATSAAKTAVNAGAKGLEMVAPTARVTGRALEGAGEGAYGLTIAPEKSTATAMQASQAKQGGMLSRTKDYLAGESQAPVTEANTAARQGLVGTEWQLGVQAKRTMGKLWDSTIAPALDKVKGQVDMQRFMGEVQKEIAKTADLTRREQLLNAFNKVAEDYTKVRSKVNLRKLQNYKSDWAEFLPDATYQGKPIASALKEVHNIMADKAREIIYKFIPEEAKQAYLDYGNLKSIADSGITSAVGDAATKSLSRNVWQFVMNKAITPAATGIGKGLYKAGQGLEKFGGEGLDKTSKFLKDATSKDITPSAVKNYKPSIGLSIEDPKYLQARDHITNVLMPRLRRLRNLNFSENSQEIKKALESVKQVERFLKPEETKVIELLRDKLGRYAGSRSLKGN